MAEEITVDTLAGLVELSPFHFSRVFRQTTGLSPPQCVTRERITRDQQMMRESERSLIEIALELGYTSASALRKSCPHRRASRRRSFGARVVNDD